MAVEATPRRVWKTTPAVRRAVIVVLVALVAGVLFGRVDLVVIAAPFAIGTVWSLWRRPLRAPTIELRAADSPLVEGDDAEVEVVVTDPDARAYDLAVVDLPSARRSAIQVPGASRVTSTERLAGIGWGRPRVGPARLVVTASDGLIVGAEEVSDVVRLKAFPRAEHFAAEDAMPQARGLVGVHRSRTYGDGGELADIRAYVPGDRLRRIDWRTSLRARELHVVQTLSDRDADLCLVLDVLHDVGTDVSTDVGADDSVLDTTVRAAAGIASHYLDRGDRVTMLEYGGEGRVLRAGSGPRHRMIGLEWLVDVHAGERRFGVGELPAASGVMPSRALVVVLTPLLDRRSVTMLAGLGRSGRSVVAVDTLPARVAPPSGGRWAEVSYRIWRLERENTRDRLLEHGIPVVRWAGAGSLDQVLRGLSRMAASR